MLQKLKSWFAADPLEARARDLYHAIVEQARHPAFYERCGVPDTANGRFDMIVLHCYCVMNRLKKQPEGYDLSQALLTVLVDDLDRNLREMGVGDLSVGKKMKRIAEGFYGRLDAYSTAAEAGRGAMVAALKRNLFSTAATMPSEDAVGQVADYLWRECERLDTVPLETLLSARLTFGPPLMTEAATPEREGSESETQR